MTAPRMWLTIAEAAAIFGRTPHSLRIAADRGRLRTVLRQTRTGPVRLTKRAWVEEYLESRPDWAKEQTS